MNRDRYRQLLKAYYDVPKEVGDSGKVITDGEVAIFLLVSADGESLNQCRDQECEICNAFRSVWWDWMSELPGPARIKLQRIMRDWGIPFPPSPWEEVPTSAVPTALN